MLGPLEAWHDGAPVPLGDQQQRFVLVVLLLHANRPVSPERLTEIVWPGTRRRRSLVRGYINGCATRSGRRGRGDRHDADRLRAAGRRRPARHRAVRPAAGRGSRCRTSDPRRAIELLRAAVGPVARAFLEDIDIDRVGGAEVISPDDSYFDAVGDLAELELAAGDHRSARDRLRPRGRSSIRPEQKHAELLMRALLAGGDRVAAIRVFHATSDALADPAWSPGPVLRNLAARAERGEPRQLAAVAAGGFTGRDRGARRRSTGGRGPAARRRGSAARPASARPAWRSTRRTGCGTGSRTGSSCCGSTGSRPNVSPR